MGVALPGSLSPSSFSAFKDCPLAFKLSYLERLPEPPSAAASKGTLVHRALERLMCRPPAERSLAAALADLADARVELAEHPEFAGLGLTPEELDAFHADAARLVERYFQLEDPTRVHPIGLELKLTAKIGKVTLRGIIDRLEIADDGEWVITDYKTGSVPSEQREQARLAGVHIYALLCEQMLGRRPARVQLLYLSKPEAIIARPSEQSVTGVARRTGALWSAIERACAVDDFRPRPGPLCGYCAFRPYCPAYGGDPAEARELLGPGTVISPTLPLVGVAP
jgi:putative RecB family exonuclease